MSGSTPISGVPPAGSVHDEREIDAVVELMRTTSLAIGAKVVESEKRMAALLAKCVGAMAFSGSSAPRIAGGATLVDHPVVVGLHTQHGQVLVLSFQEGLAAEPGQHDGEADRDVDEFSPMAARWSACFQSAVWISSKVIGTTCCVSAWSG